MKALIVGSGVSGRSVYDKLKNKGYDVSFAKSEDIHKMSFESDYLDRLFNGLSFIVTSPGISPKIELLKQARKCKIKIIGEFEWGCQHLKSDIIITFQNQATNKPINEETISFIK